MPYSNGQFEEPDNDDRAEWACSGLVAYAMETRNDPGDQEINYLSDDPDEKEHVEEVVSDFLCDLRHLLDKAGISFDAMLTRSAMHYVEEYEHQDEPSGD